MCLLVCCIIFNADKISSNLNMQLDIESQKALEDVMIGVGALFSTGNKQCITADAQGS